MDTRRTPTHESASVRQALRELADSAQMLVWMTDANDNCLRLNESQPELFASGVQLNTSAWLEYVHPDDRERIIAVRDEARLQCKEYQLEYRIVRSDGSIRWMMGAAAPRVAPGGEFLGYNGTTHDVTDRHEALERLAKSEAGHRLLAENSSDLLSHHAPDGSFIYASPSFERVLGYTPSEMLGTNIYEHVHPDDAQVIQEEWRTQICSGSDSGLIEFRLRHKKGHYIWVGSKGRRLVDPTTGKIVGMVSISRDTTFEREAKEELRRREERFRSLTNLSSDWYWETDDDDRFVFISDGVQRLFGMSPLSILGKTRLELISDPDQSALLDCADKIARREPFKDVTYRFRMGNEGVDFHNLISGEPVFRDGVFIGYRGVGRNITKEKAIADELARLAAENKALIENSLDIMVLGDHEGRILRINEAARTILGYEPEELLGKRYRQFVARDELEKTRAIEERVRAGTNIVYDFESRWFHKDGRIVHLSWALRWSDDKKLLYATGRDISESYRTRIELKKSKDRLHAVLESIGDAFFAVDRDWRLTYANRKTMEFAGLADDVIGRTVWEALPQIVSPALCPHYRKAMNERRETFFEAYCEPARAWLEIRVYPNEDGLSVFFHDITERKQAEARLEQLATHDTLTGLPNRARLNERLQQMLDFTPRDESVAVMFIDLDRFKEVNDSLGHEAGDQLLCAIASRLKDGMRPSDIVARLGGDEFVVAAHCAEGPDSAARIAEKLLATLAEPVQVGGHEVFVGASIGISMFPQDGQTRELLFQNADTAMYRAKASGRKAYRFFEEEMSVKAKTRMTLEHSLRRALERREFELHYQPRVNLKTMEVVGMEALIRWNHPQLGRVPPLEFIPIAEESGLIEPIGKWVLEEACAQARRLMDKLDRNLCVSVNLSAHQLKCSELVQQVADALQQSGLPPHLLELELTETALVEDIDVSVGVLKKLRDLGILLAIDDFGTGYSGLAYLRRFPLTTLKLDRSFVNHQDEEISNFSFIKAFVNLARALKLSVVAEGVEGGETLEFLKEAACDEAQGYFLAQPLPIETFESFLSRVPDTAGSTA
ncbi:PAS domain S-box protein [Noviherbaspirillum massiliense]|nr:PAS domain S-box protein [Noviherbaspirillum massiliense]